MTIHLELFITQNILANLPILWAASRACGRSVRCLRLLIAALIGALYAVASCLPGTEWLASLPMRLLAAIGLAAAVIGGRGGADNGEHTLRAKCSWAAGYIGAWIKASLFIWLATFLFGGIGFSLITFMAARGWGIWGVLAALCGGSGLIAAALRLYDPTWGRCSVRVEVRAMGHTLRGLGLVDTGNRLTDPYSGLPVAILSHQAAKALLPNGVLDTRNMEEAELRAIPYTSIGGSGVLWALRPELFLLDGRPADLLLALPSSVSLETQGGKTGALHFQKGEYDILLPAGTHIPKDRKRVEHASDIGGESIER